MALWIGPHSSNGSAMTEMPMPKAGWSDDTNDIGGVHNTSSCRIRDVFGSYRRWTFTWPPLSPADKAKLGTEAARTTSLDMSPPETTGSSGYFHVVSEGGLKRKQVNTGVAGSPHYWELTWTLVQT